MLGRNSTRLITLLLSTGLLGIAAACSSTADPVGGGTTKNSTTKKDAGSSSGSSGTSSGDPIVNGDAGTSSGGNADKCAAETTGLACAKCCGLTETTFEAADKVFEACACETDTDCKTECGATFCSDQEPSAACETCLTQKCDPKGNAACEANATCKAFIDCEDTAGCQDKPQPDAG